MKRIACAVLAFIPLVALASSSVQSILAPACSQDNRDNPTVICASRILDRHYPAIVKTRTTCYKIDISRHRSHGFISVNTENGIVVGFKENAGIQECGYWSALMDLQQKILDAQTYFLVFHYKNWHIESCDAP